MAHSSYGAVCIATVVYNELIGLCHGVSAAELREIMRAKAAAAKKRANWAELVESLTVTDIYTALCSLKEEEGSGVGAAVEAGEATHFWFSG